MLMMFWIWFTNLHMNWSLHVNGNIYIKTISTNKVLLNYLISSFYPLIPPCSMKLPSAESVLGFMILCQLCSILIHNSLDTIFPGDLSLSPSLHPVLVGLPGGFLMIHSKEVPKPPFGCSSRMVLAVLT